MWSSAEGKRKRTISSEFVPCQTHKLNIWLEFPLKTCLDKPVALWELVRSCSASALTDHFDHHRLSGCFPFFETAGGDLEKTYTWMRNSRRKKETRGRFERDAETESPWHGFKLHAWFLLFNPFPKKQWMWSEA